MTFKLVYECEICHGHNHAARLHCQYCGAIPTKYSFLRQPIVYRHSESVSAVVRINVAPGAQRLDTIRTVKSTMRTVPLDYYASGE